MKTKIVVKRSPPQWVYEVYAEDSRDGYRDSKMRRLVATGHRSTETLAHTAAKREEAVYIKMTARRAAPKKTTKAAKKR